ncbi:MAG: hypothetical protein PWP27_1449 [Clostridiales bacterium]|jgi:hypothetical protein|nr:hypothetical protein [Clostridiales bacterium]MDK2933639.1 hypothetical protein [Clostridiales bacterium]
MEKVEKGQGRRLFLLNDILEPYSMTLDPVFLKGVYLIFTHIKENILFIHILCIIVLEYSLYL